MILTDAQGRPFERPRREAFTSALDYLRACWAYRDAIAACANRGFEAGFRAGLRADRRP